MALMRMWKHDGFLEVLGLAMMAVTATTIADSSAAATATATATTTTRGATASLGINYGKVADNLPAPAEVVALIQSTSLAKTKLYDPDPLVLRTFGNTGISFLLGVPNEDLPSLSSDPSAALAWVQQNVASFLPSTNIVGIIVGNEIFSASDSGLMSQVLPAMKNIYSALSSLGLQQQMLVSTTHSFGVLANSYPPSAGSFTPAIATAYMQPLLAFLSQTGAPFMINAYPFFAYKDNPATVSLEYVLFQSNPGTVDSGTGLHYYNMFDAQMDAVYSAIEALGFKNLTVLVSETGWPSAGDPDEPGASVENAQLYHNNLFQHLASNQGTPLRPNTTLEVYLFALFNEDLKTGPTSERNYGLFNPDGTKVYSFDFAAQSSANDDVSSTLKVSMIGCSLFISVLLCV